MTALAEPEVTPLGATALLARFGDSIDRGLTLRIARLVDVLTGGPGIVDLIPAYTTLVVIIDPAVTSIAAASADLTREWQHSHNNPNMDNPNTDIFEIPVIYGGVAGPDLGDVAGATGLTADEVVRRHCEAEYTVGALGFSPGFAFLIGLPPELAVPRRPSPRVRVPAGSVGIGGAQTGIYSLPTPGGWNLIGRTTRVMFDPAREGEWELRPGDRIRFVAVDDDDVTFPEPAEVAGAVEPGAGAIEIVEPGVQSSVQDLGRPGQGGAGITPGGALDRAALVAGNRLLGNPDGAAAIEWTLLPPALRFHDPGRMTLTGADPGWRRNGKPVAIGEVIEIAPGDELRGQPGVGMTGGRGYVCVSGGIDVPVVRGSRALDLSAGFGGGTGRPLRTADRLAVGHMADDPSPDRIELGGEAIDPGAKPFRIVRGPQADRFDEAAWETFLSARFTVDAQSNRMGLRLNGPAIVPAGGADVISEGVVTGAIQVTGSGQPIVLMPGRATIGGYTKIATVIEADHDRLGQLRPGAVIHFREVSVEDAEAALGAWRPSVHGGLHSDEEPDMTDDRSSLPSPDAWTPDGVIRVIRELAAHDVQAFSLRVESAGLEIAIDRGGGLPVASERAGTHRSTAPVSRVENAEDWDNTPLGEYPVITSPLLGTFWRRPAPEAPSFVDAGDTIEAGQTVGLIEVMKSFHEVTATHPGVVRRFLVDEGDTVEYGQSLVELEASPEG